MTIFHMYMAVIKRNLGMVFTYFIIFTMIAVMISRSIGERERDLFVKKSVTIAVQDLDDSTLSRGLITYLDADNEIIATDGNAKELTRQLYYREIAYVLTIPENFEKELISLPLEGFESPGDSRRERIDAPGASATSEVSAKQTDEVFLSVVKLPGSTEGYYIDADIDQFLSRVRTYMAAGFDAEEAVNRTLSLSAKEAEVTVAEGGYDYNNMPGYAYTFSFFPYLYLSGLIFCVAYVMKVFRDKHIADRLAASPVPAWKQTLQGFAAFFLIFVILWVLSLLVPLLANGTAFYVSRYRALYLLNTLMFLLVAGSIAFLIGSLVKSDVAISALTNIIGLGMCFLGGVFVSLDVLNESVQKVSHFLPTYWYVRAVNTIAARKEALTLADYYLIGESFIVQAAFAAAVMALTLYIVKKRDGKG